MAAHFSALFRSCNSLRASIFFTLFTVIALSPTRALGEPSEVKVVLFLHTKEDCPLQTELAECRRLSVERYRELGYTVVEADEAQFDAWLAQEGAPFKNAIKEIQRIAFARARRADVIGGIIYYEPPKPTEAWIFDNGTQFHGWSLNLRSCYYSRSFTMRPGDGTEMRAIPLADNASLPFGRLHGRKADLWRFPDHVEGRLWKSGKKLPNPEEQQRALLGVRFLPNTWQVRSVFRDSPAAQAGIVAGDTLVSIGSKTLEESDPCRTMEGLAPGEEIPVTWIHQSEQREQTIRLENEEFVYERQRSLLERPAPNLTALDSHGDAVSLSQFRGRVVLLSTGGLAYSSLPMLEMMAEQLGPDQFVWLQVSTDQPAVSRGTFIEDNHLSVVKIFAPNWPDELYVWETPNDLLIDQGGVLHDAPHEYLLAQEVFGLIEEGHKPTKNSSGN